MIRQLNLDKHLRIEVLTMAVDLAPTFINNRGRDRRIGRSTWRQHLLIEVATVALAGRLGANNKLHHGDS